VFFGRGTAYLNVGEYDKAIPDFERAISLDSQFYRAYYNLGWIHLHRSRYERGIELNSEAIRLNGRFGEAYMNRSFGLRMLGKYAEAERDLLRACELGVEKACTLAIQTGWNE
jgi:tetratricopeptide (TPR) repeat protein